jgi:hypothetical protein
MEQKSKLMVDRLFNIKGNLKYIGIGAFLFFLIKGIIWLIIGGTLLNYFLN